MRAEVELPRGRRAGAVALGLVGLGLASGVARAQPAAEEGGAAPPAARAQDGAPVPVAGAAPRPAPRTARVAVIPLVVAHGPVPEPELLDALGAGLGANPAWDVMVGKKGSPLPMPGQGEVDAALLERLQEALSAARALDPEARWAALIALRDELESAGRRRLFAGRARALYLGIADALIETALARGDQAQAKEVADRVALAMPGRRAAAGDGLSVVATALIAAASPEPPALLKLVSQPPGCALFLDGVERGVSVVEVGVLPGLLYEVRAVCPAQLGSGVALRRVVAPDAGKGRVEVLDTDFDRAFHNDADGTWLQFVSSAARAALEPEYARRAAEKLDLDAVAFVSLGELAGTEYLNGRVYLRSGFRNRQGLARLGVAQSQTLGRYLATGDDPKGAILRPEDTAKLAPVADVTVPGSTTRERGERAPWYTDTAGWGLTGGGLVAMALGLYFEDVARDLRREAKAATRNGDPFRRDRLQSDATDMDFLASIGLFGGGLMAATGVVLLALPEYKTRGELFVLRPAWSRAGSGLTLSGRF